MNFFIHSDVILRQKGHQPCGIFGISLAVSYFYSYLEKKLPGIRFHWPSQAHMWGLCDVCSKDKYNSPL